MKLKKLKTVFLFASNKKFKYPRSIFLMGAKILAMEEFVICPKCGQPGRLVKEVRKWETKKGVIEKTYYRVYHGYDRKTKRKHYCWLGPDEYDYVTKTHPMRLMGAINPERIPHYLREIANAIEQEEGKIEEEILLKILEETQNLLNVLRSIIKQ